MLLTVTTNVSKWACSSSADKRVIDVSDSSVECIRILWTIMRTVNKLL